MSKNINKKYKVGTVLGKYDLEELHAELPDLWLGDSGEAVSLRDLARQINVAVVESALESAAQDVLDGEAENIYRLLTDDDVSAGVRTQQRNRLERAGVDVDELEADFVTHQAVYTYLTDGLGVSKDTGDETDPTEKHRERIQRLRSRLEVVTEQSLSELQKSEELTSGTLNTTVALQIYCQECDNQYELTEFLERGGCNCEE